MSQVTTLIKVYNAPGLRQSGCVFLAAVAELAAEECGELGVDGALDEEAEDHGHAGRVRVGHVQQNPYTLKQKNNFKIRYHVIHVSPLFSLAKVLTSQG